MTIKEALAKLTTQLSVPLSEYAKLEATTVIGGAPELVAKLEPFHLPEVIKLICSSEDLLEKYAQYKSVAVYYNDSSVEAIYPILQDTAKESSYFTDEIFPFASPDILNGFVCAYNRYVSLGKQLEKSLKSKNEEKSRLTQKITERLAERKQCDAELTLLPENSEKEKRTELKRRITTCKGTVTKAQNELEKCQQGINDATRKKNICGEVILRLLDAYNAAKARITSFDADLSEARQAAFDACDEKKTISGYIRDILVTGTVPQGILDGLKQYTFSQQLLSILHSSYEEKAVPILAKLYENGVIDIYDEPFSAFLSARPEAVSVFFVNAFVDSAANEQCGDESDFISWLDFIIDNAFPGNESTNQVCRYDHIWEHITTATGWQAVIDVLLERKPEMVHSCIAKLLLRSGGMARKQLSLLVQKLIENETIDSLSSLISELIDNHTAGDDAPAIVDYFIQKAETEQYSLRRSNERMSFKINRLSSDVYGAVSGALDSLETLASNLDCGGDPIAPELVASKLKKSLVALREGLEVVGISPLEDSSDWLNRSEVTYDATKHNITFPGQCPKVYIRTLGFVYTDSEGEKKSVPAKVGLLQDIARKPKQSKPNKTGRKTSPQQNKTNHASKRDKRKGGAKE